MRITSKFISHGVYNFLFVNDPANRITMIGLFVDYTSAATGNWNMAAMVNSVIGGLLLV